MVRILLFLLAVVFAAASSKSSSKFRIGQYCEQNGMKIEWNSDGILECLDHHWVRICPDGTTIYDEAIPCPLVSATEPYTPIIDWWPTTPNPLPTYTPPVPTGSPYPNTCSPFNSGLIRLSGYEKFVYLSCDQKPVNGIQTCVVQEPIAVKK